MLVPGPGRRDDPGQRRLRLRRRGRPAAVRQRDRARRRRPGGGGRGGRRRRGRRRPAGPGLDRGGLRPRRRPRPWRPGPARGPGAARGGGRLRGGGAARGGIAAGDLAVRRPRRHRPAGHLLGGRPGGRLGRRWPRRRGCWGCTARCGWTSRRDPRSPSWAPRPTPWLRRHGPGARPHAARERPRERRAHGRRRWPWATAASRCSRTSRSRPAPARSVCVLGPQRGRQDHPVPRAAWASSRRRRAASPSRAAPPTWPRPPTPAWTSRSARWTWRSWGRWPGRWWLPARRRDRAAARAALERVGLSGLERARYGELSGGPAPAGADRPRAGPGRRRAAAGRAAGGRRPGQRRDHPRPVRRAARRGPHPDGVLARRGGCARVRRRAVPEPLPGGLRRPRPRCWTRACWRPPTAAS